MNKTLFAVVATKFTSQFVLKFAAKNYFFVCNEAHHLQTITIILRRRRLTFADTFESAPQPVMDVLFLSLKGTRTRGNRSNF